MVEPAGEPVVAAAGAQAFALLSRQRSRVSRWLSLASDVEIADTLSQVNAPACTTQVPGTSGEIQGGS